MAEDKKPKSAVHEAVGVVTSMGKLVGERLVEFADEVDDKVRETLGEIRELIDEERADGKKKPTPDHKKGTAKKK